MPNSPSDRPNPDSAGQGPLDRLTGFFLRNKFVVFLLLVLFTAWGIGVAPFDWKLGNLPRSPVPVDAIPDIGENQQIVFTEWMGRSPQDVEDQVGYPLTVSLLGVPGVKTVRSYSMFGFSSIYVIFEEGVDFYWSRSRLLEKLNSLPPGTLPDGVRPALGPDATALGQVFWYTLEGHDEQDRPTGGWDLEELRGIQDWTVRYALLSAEGISEVASIGGFVREYQIDVDPDAMRAHGVTLQEVFGAVRMANLDVGARSVEINRVEYFIRGLGFIKTVRDVEMTVVKVNDNVPLYVKNVARVTLGPALRRGALDKGGAEAVGGVVVVRQGANPLASIENVKRRVREISPGLPEKAVIDFRRTNRETLEAFAREQGFAAFTGDGLNQEAWLAWVKSHPPDQRPDWLRYSQVTVVPFYDRTGLIHETLGTLNTAISEEILVTLVVVLVMVAHLASSALIAGLLPLAVLITFIAMRHFGVDANIVALSGIVIAIGTMVDVGIVICENIIRRLDEARGTGGWDGSYRRAVDTIHSATSEVGGAVLTAVATTIVGFLPVFAMEGAEGKLFKPLAFTKTFALIASILVALVLIPPFAHVLFTGRIRIAWARRGALALVLGIGAVLLFIAPWWLGTVLILLAGFRLAGEFLPPRWSARLRPAGLLILAGLVTLLLSNHWLPLGPERGRLLNFTLVAGLIGSLLAGIHLFQRAYVPLLRWTLAHKAAFLSLPLLLVLLGAAVWLGAGRLTAWLPSTLQETAPAAWAKRTFPGLGKEFMPPLDEGSYLFMPTTMPHASIGEALDVLQKQDLAIQLVPEVESVVGKLGRAETSLDPAPISMFETIINYRPEYLADPAGRRLRFRFEPDGTDLFRSEAGEPLPGPDWQPYVVKGRFPRDDAGRLMPDSNGAPFRLWRPPLDPALNPGRPAWPGIGKPDDIWDLIVRISEIPGTTSAPRLQPIAARIVMLQSGMRAPMGVKVKGPDLATIERVGLQIERFLKEVPAVEPSAVIADRIVAKPYLEFDIDREAIARYGVHVAKVQEVIEVAVGGKRLTTTVEGRERYPVRVRYPRELRDQIETLGRILVPAADGTQIPITQLAEIRYRPGPQVIKSEDTFLIGYVVFDKRPGAAEVDTVEACQNLLRDKIASGEFDLPDGVSYTFAGSYQNQVRASRKLAVVVPLALFIIFFILYLQFRSVITALLVFSGIIVAWAGGFLMIWLYGLPGFLDFHLLGVNLRELFQLQPVNLSVAIWVGFLALFGIASDNGVLVASILDQTFERERPRSIEAIRQATVEGARLRIRPALMTSATTLLALLPVLTSTGRGSDIMIPMAIPTFGGMAVALITVFVVPVLYCQVREWKWRLWRAGATGST